MSSAAAKDLTIRNTGTNRVVIGPGPASKGGSRSLVKFDTSADDKVPAANRIGQSKTVTDEAATALRGSKVLEAVGSRLGLRIS